MRTQRFTTLAMLLAFTMTTTTALAQGNREGRRGGGDRSDRSGGQDRGSQDRGNRGGGRGDTAVSRSGSRGESSRGGGSYQQSQPSRQSDNRSYGSRSNDSRSYGNGSSGSRSNDNRSYGNNSSGSRQYDYSRGNSGRQGSYGRNDSGRNDYGRNDNRRYDTGYSNRGSYGNRGSYSNRSYGYGSYNYGYGNYGYSRGRYGSYDRDAWRGRIRFGLGLSIFAGRPFSFRFDYGWRPSFDYRYSMRAGMAYGGMSFLLNPPDAEVYIDGVYVGIAGEFGGQPVPIASGYHHIELYAQGYEPAAFDITVLPGQVIPYRGDLYRVY